MKKVLFLGGSYTQIPAISYARNNGYYVVTADYLPGNPGHKLSHEYHNCSTTDMDAILSLASNISVDGIVAYASEAAAPTAAFVAEHLGLPTNPYKTVNILTSKHLYRKFLLEQGFSCPRYVSFKSTENINLKKLKLDLPIVVKPVDSSGSKGVSILRDWNDFNKAFKYALSYSASKRVILEEFVGAHGVQILGEGFIWEGKLILCCLARHRFNHSINGLVPIGGDFPYGNMEIEQRLKTKLQKFIDLIGLKYGPVNLEFRIDKNDKIYLMEVAPRNGGNMLPQLVSHATGFDMVKNTINVAIGLECDRPWENEINGFYSYYVLHSTSPGRLKKIRFSKELEKRICESNIWGQPRDDVYPFEGANCSLGVLLLSFSSQNDMVKIMDNIDQHVTIDITES